MYIFQPFKADADENTLGWNKQTIYFYSEHANVIKRMIHHSAKMFNRPKLQSYDADDIYQEVGKLLYESEDYNIEKAYDGNACITIEQYIGNYVKSCVQKFCTAKKSREKKEMQEMVYEDMDGKRVGQFDFMEDNQQCQDFYRLDYDLRKLCESYECHRYKFGCDIFQLIYVRFILVQNGMYNDRGLYDSIMTVLGVDKKTLQLVERRQYKNDILVQILRAANEIGFKNQVSVLEDFVYGAEDIKQAVQTQIEQLRIKENM